LSRYLLKRLLLAVPVLLGVSIVVFTMIRLIPGDPALLMAGQAATEEVVRQIRQSLGLDRPIVVQYAYFIRNIARGDLGRSLFNGAAVTEELGQRFPRTARLALAAILVALLIGVPAGILSATRHLSWVDTFFMVLALAGVSMPVFWLGLNLILIFAVRLQWLPAIGHETWKHLILPAFTLGAASAAIIARMTRSAMLEVIRQDYIRTARAKGLRELFVVTKHALRNAALPILTIVGVSFGVQLSGTVLVETVFARPGMGSLLISAIYQRDYPQVQALVAVFAASIIVVNIVVDLLYGVLDPRIRVE